MVVTNISSTPISNWRLSFSYPHNITSLWDALIVSRTNGQYVIGPPTWNPTLAPGASIYAGWVAQVSGAVTAPSACLLGGQPVQSTTCVGSGGGGPAPDTLAPSVPANLRLSGSTSSSLTLRWNASTDNVAVTGYELLRGGSVVASVSGTTATVSGLQPGTGYTHSIRAFDAAGNRSAASAGFTASTSTSATCSMLPATPLNLRTTGRTSSTISIAWDASPAIPNCTTSYRVIQDGVSGGALSSTTYTGSGFAASSSHTFAVVAVNSFGSSPATGAISAVTDAAAPPPPPGNSTWPTAFFAPYVDMLLWPTPVLADVSLQSGVKRFTLAFFVSRGGCSAAWGGIIPIADRFALTDIQNLRQQGGDVIGAFGGAVGVELAQACTTVSSLQAQYQSVIDTYSLTRIDFDIEGAAIADVAANDRRAKAIAGLQAAARAAGKTLLVQFTLPVLPTGLTLDGVNLLRNAVQNSVDITTVNIMAMDYGGPSVANPYQMGQEAVNAMNSTFAQMKSVYGASRSDAQLRAMQGVTPMIGLNDVSPEVFTLSADAQILLDAARANRIGLLSMWSVGRDRPCPGANSVSPTCSGITQGLWGFSTFFNGFYQP